MLVMPQALWAREHVIDELQGCKAVGHEGDLFCWRNGLNSIQNGCQLNAEACIELAIMMLKF